MAGTSTSVYRYSEARIYAGDPLIVVGRFTNRRFEPRDLDDEPVDIDATDGTDHAGEPNDTWAATDAARSAALTTRAATLTPLEIGSGGKDEPIVLSTLSEPAHVAMAEMQSQAAFTIAAAALATAALVVYTRLN